MEDNVRNVSFIVVFSLVVVLMGFLSFAKLVNFYVNKERDYNEWTPELGTKFETDIASTFYDKFEFVNFNGAVRKILGQRIMNNVIKLNNGALLMETGNFSDKTIKAIAESIETFDVYLKSKGIPFLFASTPYASGKYDPQLPIGVHDPVNGTIDKLMDELALRGVDFIDFRETMHEDGIDHYDMMYKTDHHWTTLGGFYAYRKLEGWIVRELGCAVDERISDIRNYTVTKYEKWHLGTRGQRTGIYFAGIDDYDLIVPNFQTTLRNSNGKIGSMQELIVNMDALKERNYMRRDTYDRVTGRSQAHFQNLDSKNDVKILIISDSFGAVVNPYLAMGFYEVYYIKRGNLAELTQGFIEHYAPDAVIFLAYPGWTFGSKDWRKFQKVFQMSVE